MHSQQSIEERLWEYIDGTSPAGEIPVIEKFLEDNEEWKHVYTELLEIQQILKSSQLEQPSIRFTKNVMEKILVSQAIPATKKYINKKIIWAIGAFFITLITGFLIYGFAQADWNLTTKSSFPIDFGKVDFSRFFSNTYTFIFMMSNVVLGLILLDRFLAGKKMKDTMRDNSSVTF
jgi:hypothetical protein